MGSVKLTDKGFAMFVSVIAIMVFIVILSWKDTIINLSKKMGVVIGQLSAGDAFFLGLLFGCFIVLMIMVLGRLISSLI